MRKRYMTVCLFASVVALLLAGCGKSKAPQEGYYKLTEFTEGDETVKGDDLEEYGLDESYAVFDEDGDGYLVLLDVPYEFSFNEKHGTLDTDYGEVTISSDEKTVTLADSEISMRFKKSKNDPPALPGSYDASGNGEEDDFLSGIASGGAQDALGAFWNDDWYGWWELNAHSDEWEYLEDQKLPVMARTTLDADGNGTIYMWDNEGELADVVCTNNGQGLTESFGTMVSESGEFMGYKVEHADWLIDPGIQQHDGAFTLDAYCKDENGDILFSYTAHLVKWGYPWSDFDEDELPEEYDWYMELVDAGEPMPDSLPE